MKYIVIVAVSFIFTMIICEQVAYADSIVIEKETEILLKVIDKLKSNEVKEGSIVRFLVEKAVKNKDGFVVIEEDADAYGTITKADSAGMLGTSGSLEIAINSVEAFNGKDVALRGANENQGASSTGTVVAGALLISPLSIFFRGVNAVIPSGTILRAYVDKTTILSGDVTPKTDNRDAYFQGGTETDQKLKEIFKKMEE